MKSLVTIALLFLSATASAQVLYINPRCKAPCADCVKSDAPAKVTHIADQKTQIVIRVMETVSGKTSDSVSDCGVIDKDNWVCKGYGHLGSYGKRYASNGIANWEDGEFGSEYN